MPQELGWDNAEEIGIQLSEKHPEITPFNVSSADLHRYVTELPDFNDDPAKLDNNKLNAIQQAWHEEFQERTQD